MRGLYHTLCLCWDVLSGPSFVLSGSFQSRAKLTLKQYEVCYQVNNEFSRHMY